MSLLTFGLFWPQQSCAWTEEVGKQSVYYDIYVAYFWQTKRYFQMNQPQISEINYILNTNCRNMNTDVIKWTKVHVKVYKLCLVCHLVKR